jgi:excinuclease ABC subunit C
MATKRPRSFLATKPEALQFKVKDAPLQPGCYMYKDTSNTIVYVGKAKVLRNRVRSYFSNYNRLEPKIQAMLDVAVDVEYLTTDSEVEALLLESNLIKKYKPKYNTLLIDDKSYVYVKFPRVSRTEPGQEIPIPTIEVVRQKDEDNSATYYGPYPDSRAVKRLIQRTRKIFPYCTSNTKVQIPAKQNELIISRHKPCFYYQINLCSGGCAGLVTRGEYMRNIQQIERIFKGEKSLLEAELTTQMKAAAKDLDFEQAVHFRNMLRDIHYVGAHIYIDRDSDEVWVMKTKTDKRQQALAELIKYLDFPVDKLKNHQGFRIECYDISNIQGRYAVSSMVVCCDGEMEPKLYRRFRIKMKNEPNDFAMMQETLTRRFKQLLLGQKVIKEMAASENFEIEEIGEYQDVEGFTKALPKDLAQRAKNWKPDESFSQLPDLIIIDGGKGQLSAAYKILSSFGLADTIPIVGLAKREEDIFKVNAQFGSLVEEWETAKITDEHFTKIHLPRKSEALYLVQRIRDEAHRFAITYHRKVRAKANILNKS